MKDKFTFKILRILLVVCLSLAGRGQVLAQSPLYNVWIDINSTAWGWNYGQPLNAMGYTFTQTPYGSGVYFANMPSSHSVELSCPYTPGGPSGGYVDKIYPILRSPDPQFFGPYKDFGCVQARFSYTMLPPNNIDMLLTPTSFCASREILIISGNYNWPLFSDDVVKTSVCWEYDLNSSNSWKEFDTTRNDFALQFAPVDKIPEVRSAIQNVRFRCRIRAHYSSRTFYTSYTDPTAIYTIYPAAPTVDESQKVVTPACFKQSNGRIVLPATAIGGGYQNIRWLLRPGTANTPCDPNGTPLCGDIIDWSEGAVPVASGVTVQNVPKGDYTLWILNPAPMPATV